MIIKKDFNKMDFDLMVDAFEAETSHVPRREIIKKLLQVQVERDCAVGFGIAFCNSTGNVSGMVNEFQAFARAVGEA